MNRERIIGILNEAIEREIGAIFQYMGQHYRFPKDKHPIIREIMERIAVEEMKHAEKFSKRVIELGGRESINTGKVIWESDFIKMLDADVMVEDEAIDMYTRHIKICEEEQDMVTKALYEEVLKDEIKHRKIFNLLKKVLEVEEEK